jgi:hypothetical protein
MDERSAFVRHDDEFTQLTKTGHYNNFTQLTKTGHYNNFTELTKTPSHILCFKLSTWAELHTAGNP